MSAGAPREVIFEVKRVGDTQKVAAIDVASGREVVVLAPANAALGDVRALALRKLERTLALGDQDKPPERPDRGGKRV